MMRAIQLCLIISLFLHLQCDADSTPPASNDVVSPETDTPTPPAIDTPEIPNMESPENEKCVKLKNFNLKIPDNPFVQGGDIEDRAWYSEVTWMTVEGIDLNLKFKLQEWIYNKQAWSTISEGEIDLCTTDTSSGAASWAALVRELLGIPEGCLITAGAKETDSNIFTNGECRKMIFDEPPNLKNKHRMFLDLENTSVGAKLLTGQVVIPKK